MMLINRIAGTIETKTFLGSFDPKKVMKSIVRFKFRLTLIDRMSML